MYSVENFTLDSKLLHNQRLWWLWQIWGVIQSHFYLLPVNESVQNPKRVVGGVLKSPLAIEHWFGTLLVPSCSNLTSNRFKWLSANCPTPRYVCWSSFKEPSFNWASICESSFLQLKLQVPNFLSSHLLYSMDLSTSQIWTTQHANMSVFIQPTGRGNCPGTLKWN